MRSLVLPALENVPTWHERDISQSSAERFIIPEACILIDYMLVLMIGILTDLQVDEERMLQNMMLTQGRTMSEAVMLTMTRKGANRQEAHELIRGLAIKSQAGGQPFRKVLLENETVQKVLTEKEVDAALEPRNYLGTAVEQVERAIEKTRHERKARGLAD
jgi:adenylosuccinate lyase